MRRAQSISTVSECKKAALALNGFRAIQSVSLKNKNNYPSGCFIYKENEVFWNKNAIAAKDEESSPICKLGMYYWIIIECWNLEVLQISSKTNQIIDLLQENFNWQQLNCLECIQEQIFTYPTKVKLPYLRVLED